MHIKYDDGDEEDLDLANEKWGVCKDKRARAAAARDRPAQLWQA